MSELSEQELIDIEKRLNRASISDYTRYELEQLVTSYRALQQRLSRVQEENEELRRKIQGRANLELELEQVRAFCRQSMSKEEHARDKAWKLEADLAAAQQQLTEVKESEQWLRVFYSSMNICGHHETHVPEGDNAQKCIYCHVESLQQRADKELEAANDLRKYNAVLMGRLATEKQRVGELETALKDTLSYLGNHTARPLDGGVICMRCGLDKARWNDVPVCLCSISREAAEGARAALSPQSETKDQR